MSFGVFNPLVTIFAAVEKTRARTTIEFDLPDSVQEWSVYGVGFVLIACVIFVYLRDTLNLSIFWKLWLIVLRLCVFATLVVIAFNPQERTQKISYRPSRVVVLVDQSQSMQFPLTVPVSGTPHSDTDNRSRTEAVEDLLSKSPLIATLQEHHDVSVYTFDTKLFGPHHVFRTTNTRFVNQPGQPASVSTPPSTNGLNKTVQYPTPDWNTILQPRGLETRLGESLLDLIRQIGGHTLSGIVVITDGGSNAGIEPNSANAMAKAAKVRLIAVGVGSTQQPANLQITNLRAPTDVHMGDAYEISAFIQGQGLGKRLVQTELLMRPEGDKVPPTVVATREVSLIGDGIPVEVKFQRQPTDAGSFEFFVRTRTATKVREISKLDNEFRKTINIVDRMTRVLIIAGGPMRDYRFVRNMLFRHSAVELDVWLQTADPGSAISQESNQLLIRFPETREELFNYDVVIAFDPDWSQISAANLDMLNEWVFSQSGGLVLMAGDVNTSALASATDDLTKVLELFPVVLHPVSVIDQIDVYAGQAWPIEFTREGKDAEFLQLTGDQVSSTAIWEEFAGVYSCYPTNGAKAGATVFARSSDPRSQNKFGEQSILLASHFFGSGRVLYFGTTELWRLRALAEEYYDRLWTKAIRDIGQTRMKRGTNRGILLIERTQYLLGQTVRVRAHLLDPEFKELHVDSVTIEIFDPNGRLLVPAPKLFRDKNRSGQYVGDFRASLPGTYRLKLAIPKSNVQLTGKLDVVFPNLETDNSRQNAQLLRGLVRDTGGSYLSLNEANRTIPQQLPNRGEEFLVDDRLETLWDRSWILYLLVGLISVEWLTRKLLKLA